MKTLSKILALLIIIASNQLYSQNPHENSNKITVYNSSNDGFPWGFSDYVNNYDDPGLHLDDLADALEDANIGIVYLSSNDSSIVVDSLGSLAGNALNVFNIECNLRGIKVYKKLSDNEEHCLTPNHHIVLDEFYKVLSYNGMWGPNISHYHGVWLDIEPHKLSNFDYTTTGDTIMEQYLVLIDSLDQMNTDVTWSDDLPIIVYLEKEFQRYYVDDHIAHPNYGYHRFIENGATAVTFMTYKKNLYDEGKLGIGNIASHPDPCYPNHDRYSTSYFECASDSIYGKFIGNSFVPSNGDNMEFALRVWPEIPTESGNYYFNDYNSMMLYRDSIASYFPSSTFYKFATETYGTYLKFLDIQPGGTPFSNGKNKSSTNFDISNIDNNNINSPYYIAYDISGKIISSNTDLDILKQELKRGLFIIVDANNKNKKPIKIKIL